MNPRYIDLRSQQYNNCQMNELLFQVGVVEMQPFPSQLVKVKRPVKIKRVKLYCDCCLPEGGEEPMAFCHKCRRWFHKSCQCIPDAVFEPSHKLNWFCNHCV